MSDSTSIMDLPTDPVGGGNVTNNISITATEKSNQNDAPTATSNMSLDQTTINQIVNGLQQATAVGATKLPSRDIAMTTNNIIADPYIQPNYVPPAPQQMRDYIQDYDETSEIINNYNKNANRSQNLDDMYNEIQMPLLLSVLYFLFQLPFFKRQLFKYFPILFASDGNLNLNGYFFNSILFGLIFYLLNKINSHFATF
jgi:hypothetical protein